MFRTVPHMRFNRIQNFPDKDALRIKHNGVLQTYNYRRVGEEIGQMTHGLNDQGLKPGDMTAILSNNMPEWMITDFAAFCLRAVVVPTMI